MIPQHITTEIRNQWETLHREISYLVNSSPDLRQYVQIFTEEKRPMFEQTPDQERLIIEMNFPVEEAE